MKTVYLLAAFGLASCSHFKNVSVETPWVSFQDSLSQLYGFRDLGGKVVIPPQFSYCFTDTFYTLAFVVPRNDGPWCINRSLHRLFKPYLFDNSIDGLYSGFMRTEDNNKIGFANSQGRVIIPPVYDLVLPFDGEYAFFYSGGKKVCLQANTPLSDCEHPIWTGGKWGIIDKDNDTIVYPTLTGDQIENLNLRSFTTAQPNGVGFVAIPTAHGHTAYVEDIAQSFDSFLNALLDSIANRNDSAFLRICAPSIQCLYCRINTPPEYDSMVSSGQYEPGSFRLNHQAEEAIPAAQFLKEDLHLIFSKQTISLLRDTTSSFHTITQEDKAFIYPYHADFLKHLMPDRQYFRISVVVNRYTTQGVQFQEHFQFIKTDDGFRFLSYDRTREGLKPEGFTINQ